MSKPLLIAFAALMALSACNTFEGMGKDVSKGGQAITESADDAQNKM